MKSDKTLQAIQREGGPITPVVLALEDDLRNAVSFTGITLLEHYAGLALQGLLAQETEDAHFSDTVRNVSTGAINWNKDLIEQFPGEYELIPRSQNLADAAYNIAKMLVAVIQHERASAEVADQCATEEGIEDLRSELDNGQPDI